MFLQLILVLVVRGVNPASFQLEEPTRHHNGRFGLIGPIGHQLGRLLLRGPGEGREQYCH